MAFWTKYFYVTFIPIWDHRTPSVRCLGKAGVHIWVHGIRFYSIDASLAV